MTEMGHNKPPTMIEVAEEASKALSDFMAENPVIQDEKAARDAKLQLDRGKLTIKDMEDERKKRGEPLREQVEAINAEYKAPRQTLEKIVLELESRVKSFLREEERRRAEAAAEAARLAEEAKQRALDAERAERDAIQSASNGVLDVDVKAAVVQADSAFAEYQRAERAAAVAEREQKTKIGGGFARAASLRTVETLTLMDVHAVIRATGMTDDISQAVLKAAKDYRSEHGELPPGVESYKERV